MRRLLCSTAALFVFSAGAWCRQDSPAQSQPPSQTQTSSSQQLSLGDAARRAREQKKETPTAGKVFTNDNLPAGGAVSTAAAQPAPSESGGQAGKAAAPAPGGKQDDEGAWRKKFADLHAKLARDQADLDVMQRELGVLSTQNYSDPMKTLQQELTRENINKKRADIEAKQKDVAADRQAIADAEDELRKSGGNPGWAR